LTNEKPVVIIVATQLMAAIRAIADVVETFLLKFGQVFWIN
jgi:hypothetical protein